MEQKEKQIGAHMSISRVRHIDDIYITQPYAPTLFSQGDLPGPELLLKFQRRDLSMTELKQAWDERRKKNTPSRSKWPESMELYCRGCSERTGEEISKPLTQFQYTNLDTAWEEVISKGMERFCRRCAKGRKHRRSQCTKISRDARHMCLVPQSDRLEVLRKFASMHELQWPAIQMREMFQICSDAHLQTIASLRLGTHAEV